MKKNIIKFIAGVALCCIASLFVACSDDNTSMNVGGKCLVEELVLNEKYVATINNATRTIKVKVPVDFNKKSDMVVTSLKLSDGAKANIKVGDHINLQGDQRLHVVNGDLTLDYQLAVRNDEAELKLFILEGVKGAIDQTTKTVTVSITGGGDIDLSDATFEATVSDDAECIPASGTKGNFTEPFKLTVKDNTAETVYTVVVTLIKYPVAVFIGNAETVEQLGDEEKAAAKWLTSNIAGSAYISWKDVTEEILSKCQFVFIHRQTPAYQQYSDFTSSEPGAMAALPILKDYWKRGGGIVLQRMAVDYAAALGAMPETGCPNNCWGGNGEGGPKMDDNPWALPVIDKTHPLWQNFVANPTDPEAFYTLDKDYTICNSASQYHWDGVSGDALYAKFDEVTGGKARRLVGNENEVSSWELKNFNGEFGKGGIICFGSGLLDWYSPTPYVSVYHENLGTLLMNAYNYLKNE